jgi:hypothetical protein
MIRAEFSRFVQSLGHATLSEDEYRLINLVNDNLESLIPLGTAGGKRSKHLANLSFPRFDDISPQAPIIASVPLTPARILRRLNALRVGPFRGFGVQQDFDLSSQVILLYGPNGTGKSSFCEALEYCLLGTVNDCSAKRIGIRDYLKNARTQSFEPPRLTGVYVGNVVEEAIANEDAHRFCFVEKNRIDEFSRIASFTPGQQEKLIAALFGIGEFDAFVSNFNDSIEGYLQHGSAAASALAAVESSLTGYRQLVTEKPVLRKDLTDQETILANSYRKGMEYSSFVNEIGGQDSGMIKALTDKLTLPLTSKTGVIWTGLADAIMAVRTAWTTRAELQSAKEARAREVSYRDLYVAILAVETSDPAVCPACETPLTGPKAVVSNPFERARTALNALEELAQIERDIEASNRQLVTRVNGLLAQLSNLQAHLADDEKMNRWAVTLREAVLAGRSDAASNWWHQVCGIADGSASESVAFLERCATRLQEEDELLSEEQRKREAIRGELAALNLLRDKIVQLSTRRSEIESRIKAAEAAIENAETTLAEATEKARLECEANELRQRISRAYSTVLSRLQDYRDGLPVALLSDLSTTVIALYNGFNRGDIEGDLMADLKLPVRPGDRIMFSCTSSPSTYFDALHVLSEGHIRCLGLAILVAKNIHTNCPVLIFDDPVNAIDSDHREGIRLTLFENPLLGPKQIILACHGEEFTKDIQNLLGAASAGTTCKGYTFLPHRGDNQLRIEVMPTKNHIASARIHFERNEFRSSLADARRGLEWVANTIWTKILPNAGVRGLSVKLSKPSAAPELFNVVQSLVKEISKVGFVNPRKAELVDGLNAFLGLNQTGREWEYLNKGIHEEENRQEFDRSTVRKVVDALEKLDRAIAACRIPAATVQLASSDEALAGLDHRSSPPLPN